jgi:hypothetical protein
LITCSPREDNFAFVTSKLRWGDGLATRKVFEPLSPAPCDAPNHGVEGEARGEPRLRPRGGSV